MTAGALLIAWKSLDYLHLPSEALQVAPNPASENWALRLHAFGGLIAIAIGPFQFLGALRRRAPLVHRSMGYIYLVGVLLGVIGAAVVAKTPEGAGANAFAFSVLAILWTISTGQAMRYALTKNFVLHRKWMIRSYALTFAAFTLRLGFVLVPMLGFSGDDIYIIVAWASWALNLVFVEWFLLAATARSGERAVQQS